MVIKNILRDLVAFVLVSTLLLFASSNAPDLLFDLMWGFIRFKIN